MQGVFPHFEFKRFIKASEEPSTTNTNEEIVREEREGEEIKQFYDKLIQESEVKREKIETDIKYIKEEKFDLKPIKKEKKNRDFIVKENKLKLIKLEKIDKDLIKKECDIKVKNEVFDVLDSDDDISIIDPTINKKLLLTAQSGDISLVNRLLKDGADMNFCDEFGWTPLMIASAEGHTEVVQELIDRGAKRKCNDKSGRNAADLARLKGHFQIENLIIHADEIKKKKREKKRLAKLRRGKEKFVTCDICDQLYPKHQLKQHQVSLTHQLAMEKIAQETAEPGFIISKNNIGYKLMKQSGWDGKSGLGSEQHKGRLFPVKSVLKRDRSGIQEGTKKGAKITHFSANDEESIKADSRDYNDSKKQPKTIACKEREIRESLGDL